MKQMRVGDIPKSFVLLLACLAVSASPGVLAAQGRDTARIGYTAEECAGCAEWNRPQRPFRVFGNVYYVGTRGLSALLITTSDGHVLLDGALPESAPQIIDNIRTLGFRIEDVALILNSHAHYDHAGGIAALQRASGARVAALPWSAAALSRGLTGDEDPQRSTRLRYPRVTDVDEIREGEVQRAGSLVLTPHFTGGHTPGGTTWTWRSCDGETCLDFVYADSQTPVSDDDFHFTRNRRYPSARRDFERGFAVLERLACDVLISTHPGASRFLERIEARERGDTTALTRPGQCREYAAEARQRLADRLAREQREGVQPPR